MNTLSLTKFKYLFLAVVACLLTSCASAAITKTEDNKTCTAKYTSLLKSSDKISMSACDAKGGSENSASDQILKTILESVIAQ